MWNHQLDVQLALLEMVWDRGYTFDSVFWWDDMGYKLSQFFSLAMYRDLLKPVHQRAIDWAHARGIKAHLHSCGDVRPFVPELVEIGKLYDGTAYAVGDNGELLQSHDSVTWNEKRGVSFNDFDLSLLSPFPEESRR